MELREEILNEAISLFIKDGVGLNLDDVASNLSISKKTIYKYFKNKEDLLIASVDKLFDDINIMEEEIYNDKSIDSIERLKRIIIAVPYNASIDLKKLTELNNKYPSVNKRLQERLKGGFIYSTKLINEMKMDGLIKNIDLDIFKLTIISAFEGILRSNLDISYNKAQREMIDIIVDGILK